VTERTAKQLADSAGPPEVETEERVRIDAAGFYWVKLTADKSLMARPFVAELTEDGEWWFPGNEIEQPFAAARIVSSRIKVPE
jgi:hypothetical protein